MRISLSFDDLTVEDFKLADLLAKHGLTATFYVPVMWESYNRLNGREPLSKDQLLELAKEFEIGSHTISHPLLTRIPYGAAEYEIAYSKPMLEAIIGKEVKKFSYPRGYATDPIKDIVRRNYDHARSTLVGCVTKPEDKAWEHTTLHVACQRREYGNQNWYDYGIKHIQIAKRKGNGYFHLWGHGWEIAQNNAWHAVERFFEVLKNETART